MILVSASSWLKTIDPSIWVGLLTFFGTVTAITLTNLSTSSRLRKQFKEDRRRDEQKRIFESRLNVYMAATEVLVLGVTSLGGLADIETPVKEILRSYTDRVGIIAKVHLICGSRVSEAVLDMVGEIGAATIDLTMGRIELDILRRRIRELPSDTSDYSAKVVAIWTEIMPLQLTYADRCVETATEIALLAENVILAVRSDLETPGYQPGFHPPFQAAARKQLDHLRFSIENLRKAHGVLPMPLPPSPPGSEVS